VYAGIVARIKVAMSPYQRKIYDALAAKVLSEIVDVPEERSRLRIWRKGKMVRLLQAASNPTLLTQYSEEFKIPPLDGSGLSVDQLIEKYPQYEEPAKIKAVVKLIRELVKNNKKVLIWTSFVHNIKTLQKSIHDLSPSIIYGDVPKDGNEDEEFNREKIIHQFKNSPKSMVLIANPSACAESISLHKICYHAIYLDRTFNGAHYMQSLDRIHRVGLDKKDKVNYWIFESKNTIDEVISVRLEEKKKNMAIWEGKLKVWQ
jgi:SNF2 family DNA or RNA helicase